MRAIVVPSTAVLLSVLACGCGDRDSAPAEGKTLTVFHAGSLAVPFDQVAAAFQAENPEVTVRLEAAGSRACARKISDLGRPCDVMASADYTVIDELLIPEHATWNIKFAANEMAIVYTEASAGSGEIGFDNWHEILMRPDVAYGRSDPDLDPCGYRAVLAMKLAEIHYGAEGLAERLLAKDTRLVRPKETDLIALLETGEIDYIFLYRSVAEQHGLEYLPLPDEINLKAPEFADLYGLVSVEVSGKTPGSAIVKRGVPMVYGITIPNNAPEPRLAARFVAFVLSADKGLAIMERNGQPAVVPAPTESYDDIPEPLKMFAKRAKTN